MPNSGKGDPSDPLRGVGSHGAQPLTPSEGTAGTAGTAPVSDATEAEAPQAAGSATGSPDLDAIASELASGVLDPQAARRQLIERAVRAQLPHNASPETVAAIRAEVEALLKDDPRIERLLRP